VLRHVSPAFAEDPVRILRVARFAARYADLGFRLAPETLALMATMTQAGEVDHLVPERIWNETARALEEPSPHRFVEILRECGALARIYPEIDGLFGVPQPACFHPEIDCGVHLLTCLRQAVRLGASPRARFAVLVHDLGKGTTPRELWPSHRGHEQRGAELIEALAERLKIPNKFRKLGVQVALYHSHCHRALELGAEQILELLESLGVIADCTRMEDFLVACEADARGRTGLEEAPYPQADLLRQACTVAAGVSAGAFVERGLKGPAVGEAMRAERLRRIGAMLRALKRVKE
jgi:tRNA nucleotidyltransferase (CCA-adding enzyme)